MAQLPSGPLSAAPLSGAPSAAPALTAPLLGPPVTGAAASSTATMAMLEAQVDQADGALHELSKSFAAANLTSAQIQTRLAALPPIQASLTDALTNLTPKLAAVDARLAQLGPAPAPGQPPEAAEIAQSRKGLTGFHQTVDTEIKQAKLLQVEAAQLSSMLTSRQHEQLKAQLWAHSRSILDPGLWTECATALPGDLDRFQAVLADEGAALAKAMASSATVIEWIAALIIALGIAIPLRIVLNRQAFKNVGRVAPGRACAAPCWPWAGFWSPLARPWPP